MITKTNILESVNNIAYCNKLTTSTASGPLATLMDLMFIHIYRRALFLSHSTATVTAPATVFITVLATNFIAALTKIPALLELS